MNKCVELRKKGPLYYVGDELHNAKQDKIQSLISSKKLDGLLFLKAEAVRYATDFYIKGDFSFSELNYLTFIPKGSKPVVGYTSESDYYRIRIRSDIEDYRRLPSANNVDKWEDAIVEIFKDYNLTSGTIGIDLLPYQLYCGIKKRLPGIEIIDSSDIWNELTVCKHPVEIEILRKSTQIVDSGIAAAQEMIKPGIREYEVAAWAEYMMRKQGSEMTPFFTTISSGVNGGIFERLATEKVIRDNEMVMLDMGCIYRGYLGEAGRTICTGTPNKIQKEIYKAVYSSVKEATKAVKPGVKCREIDGIVRDVIKNHGYEEYGHKIRSGHQLGYGFNRLPAIDRHVDFQLKPNMVIVIEPRITISDRPEIGTAHLVATVLVTETGHEVLNTLPLSEDLNANV